MANTKSTENLAECGNKSKPLLCDADVESLNNLGFTTYSTCGCKSKFEITYQINQDCFTNFYCGKHKNKLLSWIKRHKFFHEVKSIA